MDSKKPEVFKFTIKNVIAILLIFAIVLGIPIGVYSYEFHQLQEQQKALVSALQEQVNKDVEGYVTTKVIKDANLSDNTITLSENSSGASTGFVTKGTVSNQEAIANEVSKILTEEYISKIESNVLESLYGDIDTIVTARLEASRRFSDDEIKEISEGVKAVVIADIESYKQQLLVEYTELNNLYTKIEELVGSYDERVSTLTTEISTLQASYDARFSALETKDVALQAQIDTIKTENSTIISKFNSLQSSVNKTQADVNTLKNDLQTRINTLQTSSQSSDVELKNALIETQNQLSKTDKVIDDKVLDNATRIIALTDKITNTDTTLTQAIEVLSSQSGADTAELSQALAALEKELSGTQNDLSESISTEMAERLKDVNDIQALISSLETSTSDTQEDIYLKITQKSNQLANNLKDTSDAMKAEYTAMITDTNTDLTAYIDQQNVELTSTMQANDNALNKQINDNDKAINEKVDTNKSLLESALELKESILDNKINSTRSELETSLSEKETALDTKINTTNTTLTNYIDTTNLETKEEMAEAIADLQAQIADLQAQINALNEAKLEISQSPSYSYTNVDGDTIRITIPSSNPNLTY